MFNYSVTSLGMEWKDTLSRERMTGDQIGWIPPLSSVFNHFHLIFKLWMRHRSHLAKPTVACSSLNSSNRSAPYVSLIDFLHTSLWSLFTQSTDSEPGETTIPLRLWIHLTYVRSTSPLPDQPNWPTSMTGPKPLKTLLSTSLTGSIIMFVNNLLVALLRSPQSPFWPYQNASTYQQGRLWTDWPHVRDWYCEFRDGLGSDTSATNKVLQS